MEPRIDSGTMRFIAQAMYRAGYLAGYDRADAGRDPRPNLTDDEVGMMVGAIAMALAASNVE